MMVVLNMFCIVRFSDMFYFVVWELLRWSTSFGPQTNLETISFGCKDLVQAQRLVILVSPHFAKLFGWEVLQLEAAETHLPRQRSNTFYSSTSKT
eukprot:5203379-Amphidinium_carterae.1